MIGSAAGERRAWAGCAGLVLAAAAFIFSAPIGCASDSRRVLPPEELEKLKAEDQARFQDEFRGAVSGLIDRVVREEDAAAAESREATIDILALSGGGDFGAFGSGLLVGWGETADPKSRRPDFDVVSGVSTGALLAPFAYVGTDESCRTVDEFYRNPKKDWVAMRGPLPFLPWEPSFATIQGLRRDLAQATDEGFARQMAAESERGKVLLVSATNLDLSAQRFWTVGPVAQRGVEENDLDRLHRILLASAAIPIVFPPIEIDGFLYADGGVTANVLLTLDPTSPTGFLQQWKRMYPDRQIPRVRYWIVVNNQIHPAPGTVQPRWPGIAGPSVATAIRSGTMAEIRWLAAEARYVNVAWKTNIEVRMLAIPDDWRPPVKGDFQKATMESLSDLGRRMGADPGSWTVLVGPRE